MSESTRDAHGVICRYSAGYIIITPEGACTPSSSARSATTAARLPPALSPTQMTLSALPRSGMLTLLVLLALSPTKMPLSALPRSQACSLY
jgi:hypothetical protein